MTPISWNNSGLVLWLQEHSQNILNYCDNSLTNTVREPAEPYLNERVLLRIWHQEVIVRISANFLRMPSCQGEAEAVPYARIQRLKDSASLEPVVLVDT